jgi:hypothetical protein
MMEATPETFDRFGRVIDELENLRHALNMPIDDKLYVQCMRNSLPEKIEALKKIYIEIVGEDPWDVFPVFGAK